MLNTDSELQGAGATSTATPASGKYTDEGDEELRVGTNNGLPSPPVVLSAGEEGGEDSSPPPPPPPPPQPPGAPDKSSSCPSPAHFPKWYRSRLFGWDQSLNAYGFFPSWDLVIAFIFTCTTLMVLGLLEHYAFAHVPDHISVFIPAFGATSTVVFAAPTAPMAQPRNVLFGHITAALIGTGLGNAFTHVENQPFGVNCAAALGVGLHVMLMQTMNLMHPPASATVVSAATGIISRTNGRGFLFVVSPVMLGSVIVLVMALLLNNLIPSLSRSPYPQYW